MAISIRSVIEHAWRTYGKHGKKPKNTSNQKRRQNMDEDEEVRHLLTDAWADYIAQTTEGGKLGILVRLREQLRERINRRLMSEL